jgi:hypothetical protein
VRKPEGKKPLGRCIYGRKMGLKCVCKEQDGRGMNWIDLAQDLEK